MQINPECPTKYPETAPESRGARELLVNETPIEGRTVQTNDLLVRLDETDLNTRLKQAEANAAAAQRAQVQVEQLIVTARHHLQTADADFARGLERDGGAIPATFLWEVIGKQLRKERIKKG